MQAMMAAMGGCAGGKGGDKGGMGMKRPLSTGKPGVQQDLGMMAGTIKSFNEANGYGFIECPDLKQQGYNNDVFLHHAQATGFCVGQQVVFNCYLNTQGRPQAKDLQNPDGTLP